MHIDAQEVTPLMRPFPFTALLTSAIKCHQSPLHERLD
jgi:hypothetical protein